MGTARAFAPGHITGIFQIFDESSDPMRNGSKGAGVCLTSGITTFVEEAGHSGSSLQISINGEKTSLAITSKRVVDLFADRFPKLSDVSITVSHVVDLPIGSGFGTSGAGALSLALALNEAEELGLSRLGAAQIAHRAEIDCKTGLGTVIAETFGGIEIRTEPGAPEIGRITKIASIDDLVVACLAFGPLSTRDILNNSPTRRRINESSEVLIKRLVENPSIENFMKSSRSFAEQTGLITPRLRQVMEESDEAGIVCSMPMFGDAVFTVVKRGMLDTILKVFKKHERDDKIVVCDVAQRGAAVIK